MIVTPVWTIPLDGVCVFPCTLVLTVVASTVEYFDGCWIDPCYFHMCLSLGGTTTSHLEALFYPLPYSKRSQTQNYITHSQSILIMLS